MFTKKVIACTLVLSLWAAHAGATGDAKAGKTKITTCSACHGPNGISLAPNYPHQAGQGAPYLIKQINDIRSGARKVPEMTGMVENLSKQDIEDIAAYFASLKPPQGQADPESVQLAQKLYRGGDQKRQIPACMACHGPTGSGNVLARFPRIAGQTPAYIKKQLVDFREGARTNDGDTKIMRDIAEKLSNKEVTALASYISGLR